MITLDVNCDLGEGGLQDHKLMAHITSCSIACGGHFGTIDTMSKAIKLAIENCVRVGAHPSYPDSTNFGRLSMAMSSTDLKNSLKSQIVTLKQIADFYNYPITHIKLHGALYNDVFFKVKHCSIVLECLNELNLNIPLFVPSNSLFFKRYFGVVNMISEGFSDRHYTSKYTLVSRQKPRALITKNTELISHVLDMVIQRKITTNSNSILPMHIQTLCIHSDTEKALENIKYLRCILQEHSVNISPYDV